MFLSVKQVVERLNGSVSKTVVYDEIRRGLLRSSRVGSKILVDSADLDAYLSSRMRGVICGAEPNAPGPSQERKAQGRKKRVVDDLW